MAFPHSHKTVFVLDRSPAFSKSCKEPIDFDVPSSKARAPGFIPMAPVTKTLWTCSVEATMEFSRIIYDIFPSDKLLRFITSDVDAKILNSWNRQEQNQQHLMIALASVGAPDRKLDAGSCSILHGLESAVERLCEATPKQQQKMNDEDNVVNRGRIICITHLKNESQLRKLEEHMQAAILKQNKLVADSEDYLPLDHCELVLLHVTPYGVEGNIHKRPRVDLSAVLSSELHTTQAGHFLSPKLVELAIIHYNLVSTTVTGIPMKEEQNASSSANYDVELLHEAAAHQEMIKSGGSEGLLVQSREIMFTSTVALKWCTPKTPALAELQQCSGAYRISPVDVNSRPSACLTNFLLNGRAVMLELPRKTGSKVMSHMLACHGGEIFIHVLSTSRSILEDPPSISEGAGGRVTDYRINDFGELMKESRLAPVAEVANVEEMPVERAKAHLERYTRYWPTVISDTIIFNMLQQIDPLHSLIINQVLDDSDVLECKKAIYNLVGMETRSEALPVPAMGSRGKGPKRDEHYRQMWSELEKFVRVHAANSPGHQKILECVLECRKPMEGSPRKAAREKTPTREETSEKSWKELDSYQKMTVLEKEDLNKGEMRSRPDSPPSKRSRPMVDLGKSLGGQSLLKLWTGRLNTMHNLRRAEFTGRLEAAGDKAELYLHKKEENGTTEKMGPTK